MEKTITILNIRSKSTIIIDLNCKCGTCNVLTPIDYDDENPYIQLELRGANFNIHTITCEICNSFLKAFGTNNSEWFVEYLGKRRLLDLSTLGPKYIDSSISFVCLPYFQGSKIKLKLAKSIELLKTELQNNELIENYERCEELKNCIETINCQKNK